MAEEKLLLNSVRWEAEIDDGRRPLFLLLSLFSSVLNRYIVEEVSTKIVFTNMFDACCFPFCVGPESWSWGIFSDSFHNYILFILNTYFEPNLTIKLIAHIMLFCALKFALMGHASENNLWISEQWIGVPLIVFLTPFSLLVLGAALFRTQQLSAIGKGLFCNYVKFDLNKYHYFVCATIADECQEARTTCAHSMCSKNN